MECARCLDRPRLRCQIPQQPAGGGSRRAEAGDQADARIQDDSDGVRYNQRLRGHAHDQQAAMLHARTRRGGRSAFCEPTLPPCCLTHRGVAGQSAPQGRQMQQSRLGRMRTSYRPISTNGSSYNEKKDMQYDFGPAWLAVLDALFLRRRMERESREALFRPSKFWRNPNTLSADHRITSALGKPPFAPVA
jgi:hypothetical protein